MENHKLSILPRSKDQTGWHNSNKFADSEIAKIKTLDSRSDKSLNAYPTPFARIHLIDDAFNLVLQDERQGTNNSGRAYKKLVSDCLDLFELIYNWNYHLKEGKDLKIINWVKESSTKLLQDEYLQKKNVREKEVRNNASGDDILIRNEINGYSENLVVETLNLFLDGGIFDSYAEISIIKLGNKPIAGISPLTGFFTTPNDLLNFGITNPFSRRNYFSKTILFENRDPKIKKYIFDFIIENEIFDDNLAIARYLEHHRDSVNMELTLNLEDLKSTNKNVFNGNLTLKSSKERSINDYFESSLVRMNFKLNDELFHVPQYESALEYDYLLPLTEAFYEDFDIERINSIVTINERDENTVIVSFKKENEIISKTYQKTVINEIDGNLIDLSETHSIQLNMAIFPFAKIVDTESNEIEKYNDFYRLMFVHQDNSHSFSNEDFSVRFGKDKTIIDPEKATTYKIEREDRTVLEKDKTIVGSTYYAINFCFDFIQVNFPSLDGVAVRGVVIPKWKTEILGNKKIDFAIDFGTTSTFIAYKDDENVNQSLPKKFELSNGQRAVALLNKPREKKPQYDWIDCFEGFSLPDFPEFFEVQLQEFVPSLINSEKYDLPFRTAVFEKSSIQPGKKKALLNSNIAFTYQKLDNTTTFLFQDYFPNLKWNIKKEGSFRESVEVFIEELFQLLRYKCLLEHGDPKNSVVSWFSPLSFTTSAKFIYTQIWETKFREIFKGEPSNQLRNITESEAPYYYYSKIQQDGSGAEKINDTSSVLTLDIGGGTTDLMYFRDGKPSIGSSFYFGANTLWGDGYTEFQNEKNNGIYLSLKDSINGVLKSTELKALNEKIQHEESNSGSDEIINFWISNNDKSGVLKDLNNGDFKLAYLLHLSALIYHSIKLISYKKHPAPTCIIFTGNGSKYLDLIQDNIYIKKICEYFVKEIFADHESSVQIILPTKNRKEATCFGGLYQDTVEKFDALTYLGFENGGESFKRYEEIEAKRDFVFTKISDSFKEFIEMFFKMNDHTELSFRTVFGIESNLKALKNYMISQAKTNLETGYNRRRKLAQDSDEITDSLFFYPIVGLIYQINKISKDKLNDFIPKKTFYASTPIDEGVFEGSKLREDKRRDSIFKIVIEDSNVDVGNIVIIPEKYAIQRAVSGLNTFLKAICEFSEFPDNPEQSIEVLIPGKIKRENNSWVITKKMQIKFID